MKKPSYEIKIIKNIKNVKGIKTLEGEIGPLIIGENCQCHFIEMPAGSYCQEHSHSTESIIYTVKGEWVLCSRGKRFHMKERSIFWFGPNVPTGYEVPFNNSAFILVFKAEGSFGTKNRMYSYLKKLKKRLQWNKKKGTPFSFEELPNNHPAIKFAKRLKRNTIKKA